jgi:carbonic anhydrase
MTDKPKQPGISRRMLLASASFTALGAPASVAWAGDQDAEYPSDPAAALNRLLAGNARFVRDEPQTKHVGKQWRDRLTKQQRPYATILGCSDSRVPPELVFDEGFGDLFIMRVAGNVIADDVMGSLSYAAEHLHTQLFVVLGHESCGAVTAAVDALLGQSKQPEHIESLLKMITPGLKTIDRSQRRELLISAAVEANVRWSMGQVSACPEAGKAIQEKRAMLVGAVYDLESGHVRVVRDS